MGILINTATAIFFLWGRKSGLNMRGAFLHMAIDPLVNLHIQETTSCT